MTKPKRQYIPSRYSVPYHSSILYSFSPFSPPASNNVSLRFVMFSISVVALVTSLFSCLFCRFSRSLVCHLSQRQYRMKVNRVSGNVIAQ